MSDLNVTEGEWFVQRTGGIDGIHVLSYPKPDHQCCVARTESLSDAYLLAQAKNMYKMIDTLSTELLHMIRNENARLLQNVSCIDLDDPDYLDEESVYLARKLMEECKPPKDRE